MVKPIIRYIFVVTNSNTMDYKVISSLSSDGLTSIVREHISQGWKPIGSHKVVTTHEQLRFSGVQHKDTVHENEYSQTMIKD